MIMLLLSLFFAGVINVEQFKNGYKIVTAIDDVSYDEAVNDICYANNHLCPILETYYDDFKKWYKVMLFSIAYAESKFKYTKGLHSHHDIGFFQINVKLWNKENTYKHLNFEYYNIYILENDILLQTELALRILLYNIAVTLRKSGNLKSIYQYTLLYHRLDYWNAPESYKRDLKKILWR